MFADAGLLFPYLQDVGFTNRQPLLHEEVLPCHLSANGLLQDATNTFCHQSGHTMDLADATPNISKYYLDEEESLFNAPQFEHGDMAAAISMMSSTNETTSMETIKVDENSNISEYFLGGEVGLFKGPDPLLEEPELELDSLAAAISMVPASSDITEKEAAAFPDITPIESEQLLDDFFCDHKTNLSENAAIEHTQPSQLDGKTQPPLIEGDVVPHKDSAIPEVSIPKSVSVECLISEDWSMSGGAIRPNFLDFQQMNFEGAFGMRRAYSDGDIKTLSNANLSLVNSAHQERLLVMDSHRIEERQEKLSRYRRKKSLRNFGRKIKYACRKALADSQPRVRGRFARTEGCDIPRIPKWRM